MDKKIFRKFGYFKDLNGIINRYLREINTWEDHLNKTKNFILRTGENKEKSKVVVLGSGWLLDVPFMELAQAFKEVVFVDIRHPRQIEHKLKNYKNIRLIETDITGLVETVYHALKTNKKNKNKLDLKSIEPIYSEEFAREIQSSDYVISVNLLNQLDILICDYIEKSKQYAENEIMLFRSYIQNNHLQLLPKNKSVLVTDYEELNYDKSNQVVNRKKLVFADISDNLIKEKWIWHFDTLKTYRSGLKTDFKVMAVEF
jgi:hypothetical protein